MKHRATIDLEFINGEIFEQEVLKAMRSSAKNIARDAVQKELEQCVKNVVEGHLGKNYSNYTVYSIVKREAYECISDKVRQTNIQDLITKIVQEEISNVEERTTELVKSEVEKYISNGFVDAAIQQTVKEVVPDKVKEILFRLCEKN